MLKMERGPPRAASRREPASAGPGESPSRADSGPITHINLQGRGPLQEPEGEPVGLLKALGGVFRRMFRRGALSRSSRAQGHSKGSQRARVGAQTPRAGGSECWLQAMGGCNARTQFSTSRASCEEYQPSSVKSSAPQCALEPVTGRRGPSRGSSGICGVASRRV